MKLGQGVSWRPLDDGEAQWVERTLAALGTDQRIGQLFNLATRDALPDELALVADLGVGAYHRFPGNDLRTAMDNTRRLIEASAVPPLISGDIEGGEVSYGFATSIPNQLGIAACNDHELSAELAALIATESRALGFNWSFTPVVDINAAFRSTVVGTRSYGSDPQIILDQASIYVAALQSHGIAATAKHWPGEGYDDRDQHLVTTVNPLDRDAWEAGFGRIYRSLIADGLMSIMAGHIALPRFHPADAGRHAYEPASVSRRLNVELLRGELGFQGLLVSDATVMGGLTSWMDRAEAVPAVIMGGCDMFLFSRDPAADIGLMREGLRSGRLTEARLEDAVRRVLTMKALLGLHRSNTREDAAGFTDAGSQLKTPAHVATARRAAAASLTLVKDIPALLPLDAVRHRRVVVAAEAAKMFIDGATPRSFDPLFEALRRAGFEPREYDPEEPPTPADTDVLLYLVGRESTPVVASNAIDWTVLHGGTKRAMNRHVDIPTIMCSFGHPYLLYDAPWVQTYINVYSGISAVQEALCEALIGRAEFAGRSPVDPFCGRLELRL